jgi:hypothetical protein
MVRMRADQSNRGTPQVNPIPISQFEEEQRSEGKKDIAGRRSPSLQLIGICWKAYDPWASLLCVR